VIIALAVFEQSDRPKTLETTSMKPISYLGAGIIMLSLGCQSMPPVTRTGVVKDIIIENTLSSSELAVSPGDEVRWVNKRSAPVRVVFLDRLEDDQLSCKENFGGLMTPRDTAELGTNKTASACFRDPGYVRYVVRNHPSGDANVAGVVKVGGPSGHNAPGEANSTTTTTTTTVTTPSNK
jgi:plastocyanin